MGEERFFSVTGKGTSRSNDLIKSDKSSSRKYTYTLRQTSQGRLWCNFQNKLNYALNSGTNTVSEDACHLWSGKLIIPITSDLQVYSHANPPTCHGPSVVHHP